MASGWVAHRHFEELDSTQSYVEREHESFDQTKLTAVSADYQTAGRGTRERTWLAPKGHCVLLTFFFRFPPDLSTDFVNQCAPNATKVLALASVEALRHAVADRKSPAGRAVALGLKWPNDIVASGKKLGGVLARAVPSAGARLDGIIVGVGLNINTPQTELDKIDRPVWPATSLYACTGEREVFDVAAVRQHLLGTFALELQAFFDGGFPALRDRVNALDALMGTKVRFRVHETEVWDAIFDGVDDDGLIVLRFPDGERRSFPSGEIVPSL